MPPIRFIVFKHCALLVLIIISLSEIMPTCSRYVKKKLLYIIIAALFSRQPFSYSKCAKSNIYLSYNIRLVSNAKYTYLTRFYIL